VFGEINKCGNLTVSNTLQNDLEEKFQFQTTKIFKHLANDLEEKISVSDYKDFQTPCI
jgi:hypothetical protein